MSSSDGIVGEEAPTAPQTRRPRYEAQIVGPLRMFIVVVSVAGLWSEFAGGALPDTWVVTQGDFVAGLVLAREWSLAPAGTEVDNIGRTFMRSASLRGTKAGKHYGFIESPIRGAGMLQQCAALTACSPAEMLRHLAGAIVSTIGEGGAHTLTVQALVRQWTAAGAGIGSLVKVAPRAASMILSGAWDCLQCVPLTGKVNRARLLNPSKPTRRCLQHFVKRAAKDAAKGVAVSVVPKRLGRKENRGWLAKQHRVELILKWLRSSRFVKSIKEIGEAADSFLEIFAYSSGAPAEPMIATMKRVHPEILRRSRVRLDCLGMQLFRELWAATVRATSNDLPNLYLFADASPQWRGLELYASSFDMVDGGAIVHRLLPAISLDKGFLDAAGKVLALLWQIFLLTGPTFFLVRLFCSRVRSITTDQGVERLLADYPQVLPEFFQIVDPACTPGDLELGRHLFPRALVMPGWQHMWDLMIRKGLSGTRFFPGWIVGLKAIVSFLRSTTNCATIARNLRKKGFDGAADIVEATKLPTFAEWRWGTLLSCVNKLQGVIGTLAANFDAALFKESRDRSGISALLGALRSADWHRQFDFVLWFTNWIGALMSWGRGCRCHEGALRAGNDISCPMKGRRLKEAYRHACSVLEDGLATANAWTVVEWSCDMAALLEWQACVRATHHLAMRKLDFLNKVPWLLARLDEPGVRSQCVSQWESCRAASHHRVTHEFLSPSSDLRPLVDAIGEDGSNVAPRLQREIDSLALIPMDDSVAEGPHARASRHMAHSRAAKWPWVAATMRLDQNLEDAKSVPPAVGSDLQALWSSYKSVVRGPSRRPSRQGGSTMQLPAQFQADLYNMKFAHEKAEEVRATAAIMQRGGPCDALARQADGTGDCNRKRQRPRDALVAAPVGRGSAASSREDAARSASGSGGALVAGGPLLRVWSKEEVQLLRQFFAVCLAVGLVYSIPETDDEGHSSQKFFQVLTLETRPVLVKTYSDEEAPSDEALFKISVQVYERWGGKATSSAEAGQASHHEVFTVQDPCSIDVIALCGGLEHRHMWLHWQVEQSDLSGCVCLSGPTALTPNLPLSSPRIPVLCLLDALRDSGFQWRDEKVLHSDPTWKSYDNRNISAQRCYLQCVLAAADLIPLVGCFPSGEPASYYQLLLQGRRAVPPGEGAKTYKLKLAALEGDMVEYAALEAEQQARQSAPAPVRQPALALQDAPKSPSIFGDDGGRDAGHDAPQRAEVGSDDDIVGDLGHPSETVLSPSGTWPPALLGQALRPVKGRKGGQWSYHSRLAVECPNPAHHKCTKSRSTALDVSDFGPLAPVYYLGAWLQRSDMPAEEHKKHTPTRAEMRAFAASYQA